MGVACCALASVACRRARCVSRVFGEPSAPCLDAIGRGALAQRERFGERRQRRRKHAGNGEIAGKAAHRIGGKQRIDADMDDLAIGARRPLVGNPRHVAVDDQDQVGLLEIRIGFEAEMHRMIGRKAHIAWLALRHRNGKALGQRGEIDTSLSSRPALAVMISGFSARAIISAASSIARVSGNGGEGARWRDGDVNSKFADRRRQDFARQHQIDRALGLGERNVQRPVDGGFEHLGIGNLVVPFDEFPQDRRLVAHFLRPVDFARPGAARRALLAVGRAACRKQDRHIGTRGIHDAAERIGGADIHMHHDELRPAGLQIIAERHRDGDILVRHGHRLRHPPSCRLRLGEGLDQRREIGAGIGEEIVDATIGHEREISICHGSRSDRLDCHCVLSI